ncbi:MAG: nuclear transport factor 2 family protein [Sulfuriferula sp.]|nr:nuclear transport factor 2 family protein [Sulfuriferula sp.]
MKHQLIQQAIKAADEAITSEDFDALMAFYADDATLDIKPGLIANGKEQIRKAFIAIAEYFGHKLVVEQGEMQIIQGADTALVIMETILTVNDQAGVPARITRRATYVFREVPDGKWLCVIDNSYGTDILAGQREEVLTAKIE